MPRFHVKVADESGKTLYDKAFDADGPADVFAKALADVWEQHLADHPDHPESVSLTEPAVF